MRIFFTLITEEEVSFHNKQAHHTFMDMNKTVCSLMIWIGHVLLGFYNTQVSEDKDAEDDKILAHNWFAVFNKFNGDSGACNIHNIFHNKAQNTFDMKFQCTCRNNANGVLHCKWNIACKKHAPTCHLLVYSCIQDILEFYICCTFLRILHKKGMFYHKPWYTPIVVNAAFVY